MKCPSCQTENPDGSKFCEGCGSKLEAQPQGSFCPGCGAQVKPGSKFCPGCGAPQGGSQSQPSPAPAPTPPAAPSYVPPPPGPSYQPPPQPPSGPTYNSGQRIGGGAPPPAAKKGGGCCGGCAITGVIALLLVIVGGWFVYNNVILSNPVILTGPWKAVKGKSDVSGETFLFEPVEGGAKMLPGDGRKPDFDIIVKPAGAKTFQTRVTNPSDSSQWADIKVQVLDLNRIKINFELSDGEKDEVEATRDIAPPK